jgi:ankyrin repeat protein
VNLKDVSGLSAFLISAKETGSDALVLVAMLNAKPKLDATDPEGNTGLHLAARQGDPDTVRRLVTAGIAVNAVNASGRTALHEVAGSGRCDDSSEEAVNVLARAGANIEMAAGDGRTALDVARAAGCAPIVARLESPAR